MPSERALKLDDTILDEFRGAGFYPDPEEAGHLSQGRAGASMRGQPSKLAAVSCEGMDKQGSEAKNKLADQLKLYLRN